MTLFEIEDAIRNFKWHIDEETGEILNADELDNLEMEKEKKIESICLLIKECRAESKALNEEIRNLKGRAEKADKKADSLETWLKSILNGEKFSTPKVNVTWRKSTRIDIVAEEMIPQEYMVQSIEVKNRPDKEKIKKAFKSGIKVEGAAMVEVNNIKVG